MHLSVFQVRLSLASLSWFGCASTWRLYVALTCSQQRILFGAGLSKVSNKVRFFHSILPAWRGPSEREAREESKSWGPASVQTLLEWTLWTRCFGVVMFGSYRVPQMWPLYRFTNLLPGWCSILARRLVPLNLSRLGNFKMHLLQWHGVGLMEQSLYRCPSPPPDLVESDPYRACCQLLCGGILKCKGEELLWPASLLIHKCFWSPREYLTHTHHTHVFISLAITFWSVQFTGRIARGGIR